MNGPQTISEARQYCGRTVRKAFGAGKDRRLYSGVVTGVARLLGEICYNIKYEDDDCEDILFKELVTIMSPVEVKQEGLKDQTNTQRPADSQATKRGRGPAGQSGTSSGSHRAEDSSGRPAKQPRPSGDVVQPRVDLDSPTDLSGDQGGRSGPGKGRARSQQQQQQQQAASRRGVSSRGAARRQLKVTQLEGDGDDGDEDEDDSEEADEDEGMEDGSDAAAEATRAPRAAAKRKAAAAADKEADGAEEEAEGGEARDDVQAQGGELRMRLPTLDKAAVGAGAFTPRKEGMAGQLKSMHLVNFMNHANFEIEFGTHVTLISGANGSGKSAVMQALQVCLGATARETGRAKKLAGHIRDKQEEARVRVTLWNTGVDAYQPETYGKTITIERRITHKSSSYFLFNARGHKVVPQHQSAAREVQAMLEFFSIDGGNPLTIVTQEMAKTFVSAEAQDAIKKYNIYMEGTMLEQIREKLQLANAELAAAQHNLGGCEEELRAKQAEQRDLERKLQKLRDSQTLLQQRDMLEKAIPWRQVLLLEDAERAVRHKLDAVAAKRQEVLQLLDLSVQAAARESAARLADIVAALDEHRNSVDGQTSRVRALVTAAGAAQSDVDRAERDKRAERHKLESLLAEKQGLDQQLSQTADTSAAAEARKALEEYQQQLTAKRELLAQAAEAAQALQQAKKDAVDQVDALINKEQAARQEILRQQADLQELHAKLRNARQQQGNRLGMFGGEGALRLQQAIDQHARHFRRRPIGPLGAHIKLADKSWAFAVERVLGGTLEAYLVSCSEDAAVLRKLMDACNVNRMSPVVTVNFNLPPHAVPPARKPANGFPALVDQLSVAEEEFRGPILNYLIDKCRVESIALAATWQEGQRFQYEDAAGRHITTALDKDGTQYCTKDNVRYKTKALNSNRVSRLTVDSTAYIENLQRDAEAAEAQLGAAREDQAAAAAELAAARQALAQAEQQLKIATANKMRLHTDFNRLSSNPPQAPPATEEDEATGVIMTQLGEVEGDINKSQVAVEELEERCKAAHQVLLAAKKEVQAERDRMTGQHEVGERLRTRRTQLANEQQEQEGIKGYVQQQRERLKMELDKLRREQDVVEAAARQHRTVAEKFCDREEGERALAEVREVVVRRCTEKLEGQLRRKDAAVVGLAADQSRWQDMLDKTVEANMEHGALEKDLAGVQRRITTMEKEAGGDAAELEAQLQAITKQVNTRLAAFNRMNENVAELARGYTARRQLYEKLRARTEEVVQMKFASFMRRRDHHGHLVIDHTHGTLQLQVKPRAETNANARAMKDLGSLSGGEKSFTTVSFLLALGHCTESPFRCLDEYDVFMDPAVRHVATETLLEFAREQSEYQYVLLTPQDLSGIDKSRQELEAKLLRRNMGPLPKEFLKTVIMPLPRQNAGRAD